jgi:hypothetical protein
MRNRQNKCFELENIKVQKRRRPEFLLGRRSAERRWTERRHSHTGFLPPAMESGWKKREWREATMKWVRDLNHRTVLCSAEQITTKGFDELKFSAADFNCENNRICTLQVAILLLYIFEFLKYTELNF